MSHLRSEPHVAGALAALLLGCSLSSPSLSQDKFPTKPVRIVVNTGAGGLVDVTMRLVAEKMGPALGQPVIVENRAGGDGLVGIQGVKRSPADGYTLVASANTIAIQPALKPDAGYELEKDFASIGGVIRAPYIIMVGASQPDKTLDDFIARGKRAPKEVTYASAGTGTTSHIAAAMFLQGAGLDLLHIPYKGNGPAMPDVMAGRVSMIFEAYGSGASKLRDGTLRALAVTSAKRLPGLKDVPAIGEKAVPGFDFYVYIGLLAPAGTPQPVIDRLAAALRSALSSPDLQQRFETDGAETFTLSPAQFDKFLHEDLVKTRELVKTLGPQLQ